MIRVHRVAKSYRREAPALIDVSFSLEQGELAFLLGPSGAGKSTLLRLLLGLTRPSDGEVLVLGQNPARLTTKALRALRRRIGWVFRDPLLLPEKSVAENVALNLEIAGLGRRRARSKAMGMLERLGLRGLSERKPLALSDGEAQRVALARALVHRPSLLLADEPTATLDAIQAAEVQSLLLEQRTEGMTVLITGHSAPELPPGGARVLRLKGGRLRGDGTHGGAR